MPSDAVPTAVWKPRMKWSVRGPKMPSTWTGGASPPDWSWNLTTSCTPRTASPLLPCLTWMTSFGHVFGPTIPSAATPALCWNALTAASVSGPKMPSTATGWFRARRSCCSERTGKRFWPRLTSGQGRIGSAGMRSPLGRGLLRRVPPGKLAAPSSRRSARKSSSLGWPPMRATYELDPPEWAETLAVLESTSLATGPAAVRARVVSTNGARVTIDFPALDEPLGVTALVSSCVTGEWADRADVRRCRLVDVEWPAWLPGPRGEVSDRVLVGAIVKPALGLTPAEVAEVAGALGRGGADLVKDDELLDDPHYCRLAERVRAVAAALPDGVLYAPNITGPTETLLERAERAVEAGASALMLNVFVQGLDALRALRV